jgi:putative GTP pyrophosphokinase
VADDIAPLLDAYDADFKLHEGLAEKLKALLEELIETKALRVHSVTARVKDREDFEKKVRGAQPGYAALCDVTDVIGLRVITHFPDEVDAVAQVIEDEFDIDVDNSTDKRATIDPDRFGYASLHYVATLPLERLLTEWKKYRECVFEIQIRSILQHAWAEIEHDLGYKSPEAIPRHIRRRFARLAGVLELADDEFKAIRDELAAYGHRLEADLKKTPETVFIDQDSILTYIQTSPRVADLDRRMADALGAAIDGEILTHWTEMRAKAAILVGFSTIAALDNWLTANGEFVVAFGKTLASGALTPLPAGVSVDYASHACAALPLSVEHVSAYLSAAGYSSKAAQPIINAIQEAAKTRPLPQPPTP